MKIIPLTQGKTALIDDADYELVKYHKWHANYDGKYWHARRYKPTKNGTRTILRMHRFLLNAPEGIEVDHINHNSLDNRRSNIRLCTHAENQHNQKTGRGSSKQKGVCWDKGTRSWRAQIRKNGKIHYLGCFESEREAARVYNKAAKRLFGEFACLNYI